MTAAANGYEQATTDGKIESTFEFIDLKKLSESPTNPRKEFGDLTELTASIRMQGILEPLLVREVSKGSYEIVCGARRFRASKGAGFTFVPCVVRDMDNEEVLEAQISENALRLDPHPMEEAEAFKRLHEEHGIEVSEIAAKVGKTDGFVYQRLKLLDLEPVVRKVFLAGKLATVTALYIARLPKSLQKKACDDVVQTGGSQVASIRHIQERYMLRLIDAPFQVGDETLVPAAGSCTKCPKRTGNQKVLFSEAGVESADLCTDSSCYDKKVEAAWQVLGAEALAKGWKVLSAEDTKGMFAYGDHMQDRSYVSAGAICITDPKQRPWGQLLAKNEPQVFLARGNQGGMHRLYKRKDAERMLEAAGHKFAAQKSTEQRSMDTAGQKAKEAVVLKKRAVELLLERSLAKVADKGLTKPLLVLAAQAAMENVPYHMAERRALLAGQKVKGFDAVTWLKKQFSEMDDGELAAVVFEYCLGRFENTYQGYSDVAKAVAKGIGVDFKKLEKDAQEKLDEEAAHEVAMRESLRAEKLAGAAGRKSKSA